MYKSHLMELLAGYFLLRNISSKLLWDDNQEDEIIDDCKALIITEIQDSFGIPLEDMQILRRHAIGMEVGA